MNVKTIHQRVQEANDKIADAVQEIKQLQLECSHPVEAREETRRRSNDEYDSTAHYATDYHCHICGKTWSEGEAE